MGGVTCGPGPLFTCCSQEQNPHPTPLSAAPYLPRACSAQTNSSGNFLVLIAHACARKREGGREADVWQG